MQIELNQQELLSLYETMVLIRRSEERLSRLFGDGAMAEGVLHECLNFASSWKLPLIFACENNGWSEFSPLDRQFAARLGARGNAFGIPAVQVDGGNVEVVRAAPVLRVGADFMPIPFARALERECLRGEADITAAVRRSLDWKPNARIKP